MQQNHQASGCFLFNLMSWAKVLTASIIHMSQNLSSWSYVLIGSCDSHSSRPRRHHLRSHDAVAWFVSPSSLSVCAQAARSAASDAWAACPGPPSSPPSSSTWAWPCSVGVATRLWAARSPSSRTTLKWSGPPETRWMCSPCEQFVHLLCLLLPFLARQLTLVNEPSLLEITQVVCFIGMSNRITTPHHAGCLHNLSLHVSLIVT